MKKILALSVVLLAFACSTKYDKSKQGKQCNAIPFVSSTLSSGIRLTIGSDTVKPPVPIIAGQATVIQIISPVIHPVASANSPIGIPHFINYNTEQGLALSGARSSYEDKMGNLWFGTEGGGVSRYDGKAFTNYTTTHGLPSNSIWSIMGDKTGNIWFGTVGGGVSKYDGKLFTTYTTAQGLSNNTIWCMLQDKAGSIWLGTEGGGVSKYDGTTFTNYTIAQGLTNNKVRSCCEDNAGNLWFGTFGGGVSKYNGKSFTNYTTRHGLANNHVLSSCIDKAGNLWFGTNGGGVSRYDGTTFTTYTTAQGLAGNTIWSIATDKAGNIWFGTEGGGVSKYDGSSFTNYTTAQGLASNNVFSITGDNAGNLWFGTESGGVSRYDEPSFTNFTSEQGLADNIVLSITEDKTGNLWFGTYGGGVSRFDGKSFANFTTAQGFTNNNVFSIIEDKAGNLWMGTEGNGVSRYDGKSFTTFTTAQGLPSNVILSILEDKTGNLWFGTYGGGVSKYDGKSFTNYKTAHGLANNNVFCITEDQAGRLWFGTVGGGVSRYDGNVFTNFTTAQGLPNNTIWSITEDASGKLWFGTAGGLCVAAPLSRNSENKHNKSTPRKNELFKFINYSINNGLPDNFITNVIQLPGKKIVVGTNKGIAVFNPNLPLESGGKLAELEIYSSGNGYPVKDVNAGQNAMYLDSRNILWAATGDEKTALARIDYGSIHHNTNPPTVVIQKVMINEKDICWYNLHATDASTETAADSALLTQQEMITHGKSLTLNEREAMKQNYSRILFDQVSPFYPIPQNLVLPYENNNVSFEFNAIEPCKPYLVNYQYMLEGYDKDWSPVLQKTSASFGHISEGTYTFKLRAQSPEGVWCKPVTYTFKVLPQWFRTWWAYLLYLLFIAGALYMLFRWRTAAFVRERELLEEKVKIRTEQLVKQTEVAESQREITETQRQLIQEKVQEITDSIHYAKRIQTALLTSQDYITENIPGEHFILFKPKDIVSGDFYWALQYKNKFYIATCDCTGHGVPGAFMSMLNISFLNKIILERGITEPHEIMNHVRDEIINALNPKGSKEVSMDGMDAVLCCYDFEHMTLTFASANNLLWLIRNNELIEYKGDKMPVGKHSEVVSPFTLQTIHLIKGDVIYTSTDGFPDQLGRNEKKLMKRNLKEIFLSIHTKPMADQKEYLDVFFENWKGKVEQVDDVCVIGVRV